MVDTPNGRRDVRREAGETPALLAVRVPKILRNNEQFWTDVPRRPRLHWPLTCGEPSVAATMHGPAGTRLPGVDCVLYSGLKAAVRRGYLSRDLRGSV